MLLRKRAWDIMREEFPTVRNDASLAEAIRVVRDAIRDTPDFESAVVLNRAGSLVGAVTVRDLLRGIRKTVFRDENLSGDGKVDWDEQFTQACLACPQMRLNEYLTTKVTLIRPNDHLLAILDAFLKNGSNWGLVEENEKIIGMVTISDLYRELSRDMILNFD